MKYLVFLSVVLLFSCANLTENDNQNLIGTWVINHEPSNVDYSIIEYEQSGDKCEINFHLVNSLEVDMYWNKWELIDGVIHTTMQNNTTFLEFGYEIQDKIETLTEQELFVEMIVPLGDSVEYHYKNSRAEPGQVCNLVKKVFNNKSKAEY